MSEDRKVKDQLAREIRPHLETQEAARQAQRARRGSWLRIMQRVSMGLAVGYTVFLANRFIAYGRVEPALLLGAVGIFVAAYAWRRAA